MGILSFLFKKKQPKNGASPSYNPDFYYSGYNIGEQTIASNETIFAAVSLLSNAIASAPITLRKSSMEVLPSENNIAYMCAFGFNPYTTPFEFIRSLEASRCTTGAAYAIKEYDRLGRISALYQLRSEYVKPWIDKETQDLYYAVGDGQNIICNIHSSNIISVNYSNVSGSCEVVNPIDVLQHTLTYSREVEQISTDQLKNRIKPNFIVHVNSELNDEAEENYTKMINRFKESGILYLGPGKSIENIEQSSVIDPKVFESEQITVKKVASVFNIPVSKLWGDSDLKATEDSDLAYLKDTILPIIRMYEQEFTKKLLTEKDKLNGYKIKFSMNGFARGNMTARSDYYQKMLRGGIYSRNEIRELEDLPPCDGGDEYYISRDLIPVDLLPDYIQNELQKGGI